MTLFFSFLLLLSCLLTSSCFFKSKKAEQKQIIQSISSKTHSKSIIRQPNQFPAVTDRKWQDLTANLPTRVRNGSRNSRYVALTFDDGPHRIHTPRLLKILQKYNVKATFYVLGSQVKAYPRILQSIYQQGHELGNHTWTHRKLTKLPASSIQQEIKQTSEIIYQLTGSYPKTFRPPYGALKPSQAEYVRHQMQLTNIFWDVDPLDWKDRNSYLVARRITQAARNGSILLLHDIHATSVGAVSQIIENLLQRGFKFVTVSQLLELQYGKS